MMARLLISPESYAIKGKTNEARAVDLGTKVLAKSDDNLMLAIYNIKHQDEFGKQSFLEKSP